MLLNLFEFVLLDIVHKTISQVSNESSTYGLANPKWITPDPNNVVFFGHILLFNHVLQGRHLGNNSSIISKTEIERGDDVMMSWGCSFFPIVKSIIWEISRDEHIYRYICYIYMLLWTLFFFGGFRINKSPVPGINSPRGTKSSFPWAIPWIRKPGKVGCGTWVQSFLSVCLSVYLSMNLSIWFSIHPSIYLSTYLPFYLSTYLSI
jgi:hypothetical protein